MKNPSSKTCKKCNAGFEKPYFTSKLVWSTRVFCSKICANQFNKNTPWLGKKRPDVTGANHHLWRGELYNRNERHILMGQMEYRNWRRKVFLRDDFICQECGERGGKLNADHIKPWLHYPKLRFELSNGRTLCIDCHKQTETWGAKTRFSPNYQY